MERVKTYIEAGLKVLPVKKDKSPALPENWKAGFGMDKFADAYGVGIICGHISGNVECLDFDNHDGKAKERIKEYYKEAADIIDKYNFTLIQTGGGGYHLLYKCNKISGSEKLAQIPVNKNGTWRPDAIIETKGEAGYVVAAPTDGYKVLKGSYTDMPLISIEERCNLLSIAKSFNTWYELHKEVQEESERPGDIYNNTHEAIEQAKHELKKAGWVHIKGQQWRRPDKKDGISATFGKVADNVFYVFSENAYPFSGRKAYTPFQIVALLKYNGNFSQFASDLAPDKPAKVKEQAVITPEILLKAQVNINASVERPPTILSMKEITQHGVYYKRIFTLGNFSAIIGKAKSKKTMVINLFTSILIKGKEFAEKFVPTLPPLKHKIIYFDTEQGDYDVWNTGKRIRYLTGLGDIPNFTMYQLREYSPTERCEIIELALKLNPDVGFVVIDGIADLGHAINDEEEATRISGLLLRWTKQYNCHIVTVIHQNKNDNFATGHLGSYVMKKCEIILSVTKDKNDNRKSIVSNDLGRGEDIQDFVININQDGLPELEDAPERGIYEQREADF